MAKTAEATKTSWPCFPTAASSCCDFLVNHETGAFGHEFGRAVEIYALCNWRAAAIYQNANC